MTVHRAGMQHRQADDFFLSPENGNRAGFICRELTTINHFPCSGHTCLLFEIRRNYSPGRWRHSNPLSPPWENVGESANIHSSGAGSLGPVSGARGSCEALLSRLRSWGENSLLKRSDSMTCWRSAG